MLEFLLIKLTSAKKKKKKKKTRERVLSLLRAREAQTDLVELRPSRVLDARVILS